MKKYHRASQFHRVQKRLVVNQCFRAVLSSGVALDSLCYVTFGGEDLCDVMDLSLVLDVSQHELVVLSYEHDPETVKRARRSPVAKVLSQVESVEVAIVQNTFPYDLAPVKPHRAERAFLYFLDYTQTFKQQEADDIAELLESGLLAKDDFLMVTGCLTPRVTRQESFMSGYEADFAVYFGKADPDLSFRVRNHVDLLVEKAFSRVEKTLASLGKPALSPILLRKFRYRDTQTEMGLWLYRIGPKKSRRPEDREFEAFPSALTKFHAQSRPNPLRALLAKRRPE